MGGDYKPASSLGIPGHQGPAPGLAPVGGHAVEALAEAARPVEAKLSRGRGYIASGRPDPRADLVQGQPLRAQRAQQRIAQITIFRRRRSRHLIAEQPEQGIAADLLHHLLSGYHEVGATRSIWPLRSRTSRSTRRIPPRTR